MRAAKMKERPSFQLMVQTDVQSIYHMQMPRWLFSDPRYCEMSLDAKVTYTFLLNRFQLSRRNGWVNERGEVFVIFPRTELQEMDKKARDTFDAFKEADLRKWTEDAAELERRCAEQSETSSQAAESLRSEIQALTAELEYGNLTQAEYDRLSLSEKIRAGMELSELIKRLTGRNYPVFVDNMESVDDLANVRPTGQIIMAKCVSNAPLQVRPIKPIVFAEQRAA